jgi:hypothetical protein
VRLRSLNGEGHWGGGRGGGGAMGLLVELDEFLEDVELVGFFVDFLLE